MKKKTCLILAALSVIVLLLAGCTETHEATGTPPTPAETVATSDVPEIAVGQSYECTTSSGNYTLVINGAHGASQYNFGSTYDGKQVTEIDYSYTNETFNDNGSDLQIDQRAFTVYDGSNVVCNNGFYASGLDAPTAISKGTSCNAKLFYPLETQSDHIILYFVSSKGQKRFKMNIPIT